RLGVGGDGDDRDVAVGVPVGERSARRERKILVVDAGRSREVRRGDVRRVVGWMRTRVGLVIRACGCTENGGAHQQAFCVHGHTLRWQHYGKMMAAWGPAPLFSYPQSFANFFCVDDTELSYGRCV